MITRIYSLLIAIYTIWYSIITYFKDDKFDKVYNLWK